MQQLQINQGNSISYQPTLPLDLSFSLDEIPQDDLTFLVKDFVENHLNFANYPSLCAWNGRRYSAHMLLEVILLAKAQGGYASLRELAEMCRFDLRFRYLLNQLHPSHNTIAVFINKALGPCIEDLFHELNEYIESRDPGLDKTTLYLDGTKIEANANKYTFVWIRATKKYRERAWVNLMKTVKKLNDYFASKEYGFRLTVLKEPNPNELWEEMQKLDDIKDRIGEIFTQGKGRKKGTFQKLYETYRSLAERLMKYAHQIETAGNRNSYSKTDPDATMMHTKFDYYCNTNVFRPCYNLQIGVSSGYVRVAYISQNCNDMKDFIPTVKKYNEWYGEFPGQVPADAGYGSFENYKFCKEHGIKLMMKYGTQEKESKIRKEDEFRSYAFEHVADGSPICPAGHVMEVCGQRTDKRGLYPKTTTWYSCQHCQECPLRGQCTKSRNGRKVQICHELEDFKAEVRENMSTKSGRKTMVSRSIQAEGTFGELKQDKQYTRLRRKGMKNVELEITLVLMGHNLRKLKSRLSKSKEEIANYGSPDIN